MNPKNFQEYFEERLSKDEIDEIEKLAEEDMTKMKSKYINHDMHT